MPPYANPLRKKKTKNMSTCHIPIHSNPTGFPIPGHRLYLPAFAPARCCRRPIRHYSQPAPVRSQQTWRPSFMLGKLEKKRGKNNRCRFQRQQHATVTAPCSISSDPQFGIVWLSSGDKFHPKETL